MRSSRGDMWKAIEPLHAVTYFSEECRTANKKAGLKGYWMGYFASRGAPLGAVSAGTIEATFFGFHPARVRRAIPDAWGFASPERILAVRGAAAARALRRAFPGIEDVAAETAPQLHEAVMAADGAGRALFAANRDLPVPDDPVEALWQAATALREHRGDGHVAVLTAEGLDGVEAQRPGRRRRLGNGAVAAGEPRMVAGGMGRRGRRPDRTRPAGER